MLNLGGVETSARINQSLCAAMGLVIIVFFVATIRYIFHLLPQGAAFFILPFYNRQTFSPHHRRAGISRGLWRPIVAA